MQLWDVRRNPAGQDGPKVGRCCSLDDTYDARRVADRLGFPFYVVNLEKEFERHVVAPFIGSYLAGRTPIPCTACNTFLKFDRLLQFAESVGIERVATGHYARIETGDDGACWLFKGSDGQKDQSYFLFELRQEQLSRILFPVGLFAKSEIRLRAEKAGLVTAAKPDSQEICFIPDGDHAGFIRRNAGEIGEGFLPLLEQLDREGPVLLKDGTQVGTHDGLFRFTVGQRKGLGIAHREPLYVIRLDLTRNALIVGCRGDVYRETLETRRVNWIMSEPPDLPATATVRIRSNHEAAPAELSYLRDADRTRVRVRFSEPQLAVTPGQAAVFYDGDRVLGGGWIDSES
jgi:tRNA-specific 2-thiouridylase